jgi:hypothetical protein
MSELVTWCGDAARRLHRVRGSPSYAIEAHTSRVSPVHRESDDGSARIAREPYCADAVTREYVFENRV